MFINVFSNNKNTSVIGESIAFKFQKQQLWYGALKALYKQVSATK